MADAMKQKVIWHRSAVVCVFGEVLEKECGGCETCAKVTKMFGLSSVSSEVYFSGNDDGIEFYN